MGLFVFCNMCWPCFELPKKPGPSKLRKPMISLMINSPEGMFTVVLSFFLTFLPLFKCYARLHLQSRERHCFKNQCELYTHFCSIILFTRRHLVVQNPFYERYNNIIVWLTLLTDAGLLCKPHYWYILHGRNRF